MNTDYLIVGSGLTGATIARILHDYGKKVVVVERRPWIGGNCYDYNHECGIRVGKYGPHHFRTSDEDIWKFVIRFDSFYRFELTILTEINGSLVNYPITRDYIEQVCGNKWQPVFTDKPTNFEEACLTKMPRLVYDQIVKPYTEKQWGVEAKSLSIDLASKVHINKGNDKRLVSDIHQGFPIHGYTYFIERLLEEIPVITNYDFLQHKKDIGYNNLIYTGLMDEFFDFEFGKLAYRGQKRNTFLIENRTWYQEAQSVNNPSKENGEHIRTVEWKYYMPFQYANSIINNTVITKETPYTPDNPDEYEYPFPSEENKELYNRYRLKASHDKKLVICGRLGDYKYYSMNHAIKQAMLIARKLLG